LLLFRKDRTISRVHGNMNLSVVAICVNDDQAIVVAENGRQVWFPLKKAADPVRYLAVHDGAGTAVTAANGNVLSSGTDGSVALAGPNVNGALTVVARVEQRLRCAGARVKNMQSEREIAILIANGADRLP
jgi:hypothetical protein